MIYKVGEAAIQPPTLFPTPQKWDNSFSDYCVIYCHILKQYAKNGSTWFKKF